MLIIAYPRDEQFLARVPFQFVLDPKLVEMDRLLDDRQLVLQVTHDLIRSAPQAAWNGRPSTPVEVTLRLSVVRRLMGWSYATAEAEIAGDAKWRWFCRLYDQPVPNHSTQRDRALSSFLRFYNRRRPHSAAGGRAPITRVHQVHGQDS